MKIKRREIIKFIKSLDKTTKLFLYFGTPIILALLVCGVITQIITAANGFSAFLGELSENLFRCASDSFAAVYIPAFLIEFIIKSS